MRIIVLCGVLVATVVVPRLSADDKIDAKKLLGTWQPNDKKHNTLIEFTKDGRAIGYTVGDDGMKTKRGEWTVRTDGNKLIFNKYTNITTYNTEIIKRHKNGAIDVVLTPVNEETETWVIIGVTDTEMVCIHSDGIKGILLVRLKDK